MKQSRGVFLSSWLTMLLGVGVMLWVWLVAEPVRAQTPTCNALHGKAKQLATEILRSSHAYGCCTDTIAGCLKNKPSCKIAKRLANQVCRAAADGKKRKVIEKELAARAASMTSTKTYPIRLRKAERAGDPKAKVTVVGYVCARCPYCSRLMPKLHHAVVTGRLRGKVKLYFKEFPIRSHPNSTEGGLAVLAAQKMHKGWKYLLHLYAVFDKFDVNKLSDYAVEVGLDRAKFERLMRSRRTRKALVRSKKEGVRNGVNATPTLFIDGRKYTGPLDFETVVDVLEEEWETR